MRDADQTTPTPGPELSGPLSEEDRVYDRYGAHVADTGLLEAQQRALLLALWQIMRAFVDLGFSVKPGDKFTADSALGMDDVLRYLHLEDTAHETVAPDPNTDGEAH